MLGWLRPDGADLASYGVIRRPKAGIAKKLHVLPRSGGRRNGFAAGAFPDIAAAIAATRPAVARSYEPDAAATAVYDRVYAIYRDLYESLGSTRPELLHELKRIHRETGGLH